MVRHDVDPQPPPQRAAVPLTVLPATRPLWPWRSAITRPLRPSMSGALTVLNYCYHRLGTWSEAEDAAQQVFLHAYTALGRFRDREGSFRSWLFTVAHHEVANRRRGQRRHPTVP